MTMKARSNPISCQRAAEILSNWCHYDQMGSSGSFRAVKGRKAPIMTYTTVA